MHPSGFTGLTQRYDGLLQPNHRISALSVSLIALRLNQNETGIVSSYIQRLHQSRTNRHRSSPRQPNAAHHIRTQPYPERLVARLWQHLYANHGQYGADCGWKSLFFSSPAWYSSSSEAVTSLPFVV